MLDITVIIPIVTLDTDEKKSMLANAINSIGDVKKIVVVGSAEALKTVETVDSNIVLLENTGDTRYAAQVNFAVNKEVKTKYFSVLEYDDAFSPIWFNNVEKYLSADTDDTFAFLPLTEVVDIRNNDIIGYANEALWASSFSEEIGYFDLNSITDYFNFNTSGGVFKTEDFKSLGMLKTSMKLVYWFEFLMRALYKGKRIFVIPKIGYYHFVNRPDSISAKYSMEMSEKEADWWIDLAKKEYFFPQDRKKTYEEE